MQYRREIGSRTARDGFRNEDFAREKFKLWKNDVMSQKWLSKMGYIVGEIESLQSCTVTGQHKSDIKISVRTQSKFGSDLDHNYIQVKLVSKRDKKAAASGFNQIDKRWLDVYSEMWSMDSQTVKILKHFTGEYPPYIQNSRDSRRMFFDEFIPRDREKVLGFLHDNKTMILNDIFKGRDEYSADWYLVILRLSDGSIHWALEPISDVINFYSGEVGITPRGSLKIGEVTIQRKGGDAGRQTANMLQFKINPTLLVD